MTDSFARLRAVDAALVTALADIRSDLQLSEAFSAEVQAEAERAADSTALPEAQLLDIPFLTIDPEGSMDLDQALCLARTGSGYQVWYAIADVPAFVAPGGAIDVEARKRGQTLYAPDGRIPLHPTKLSEGAASLLPGQNRGAYVWAFEIDSDARVTATSLTRAQIRSRTRWNYEQVQQAVDGQKLSVALDASTKGIFNLLREVGQKRELLERERGGASLARANQEVVEVDGRFELVRRRPIPAEGWNAQLSLMTGMAAAKIMLDGRVGILRTMPAPDDGSLDLFRRRANALGRPWPKDQEYGAYLRELDTADPKQLAIMSAAASLFRGAGYTAFEGVVPKDAIQAAVAAPYAHTTAPLRRLVDRFTLVVCEALANGREVPDWARMSLDQLPALMAASATVAAELEHRSVSAVEAAVLSRRVGDVFPAAVISVRSNSSSIQLDSPAVTANCEGVMKPGERIEAELIRADIASGTVVFRRVEARSS